MSKLLVSIVYKEPGHPPAITSCMSDEPDLGDEFKGIGGDYENTPTITPDTPIFTSAQMTAAIQANIKARDDMRRDMDELEDDLMYARDGLRDVLDWMECSQSRSALRAIVNRGLRQ